MGWEVVEVVPITCLLSNLWELLLRLLIMPCYASRLDWVSVSMTDVRLLINGLFKVATLIHIWVD